MSRCKVRKIKFDVTGAHPCLLRRVGVPISRHWHPIARRVEFWLNVSQIFDGSPLAMTSDALDALKPVSFRLKKEFDPTQALGFGLIAEEVEKVNADLVYRNNQGQVESVRYEMVNATLLSEFLKEHEAFIEERAKGKQQDRKIQEQEATIAQLKKEMETVLVRLGEHDSEIQRVSDQAKTNGAAAQFVSSDQ